jgi:hypothetical protein
MPCVSLAGLVKPICKIQHQCELFSRQCDLFCRWLIATRSCPILHNSQALLKIPNLQLVPVAFETFFHGKIGCPIFNQCAKTLFPHDILIGFSGGASRDRTDDLCSAIAALSQLSYSPTCQEGAVNEDCPSRITTRERRRKLTNET